MSEIDPKLGAQTKACLPSPAVTTLRAQEYSAFLASGAGNPESSRGRGPPCVHPDSAPAEEPGQTDPSRQQPD